MEFKIIEKNEDITKCLIEQRGHPSTFTLAQIEASQRENTKLRNELEANIKSQEVTTSNIEEHHPFVKEMSEEDLFTCSMYQTAKQRIKIFNEKLSQLDEVEKIQNEDIAEMYKQLPELAPQVSLEQPNLENE